MVKKKSYNPFKMWGSYVGVISILLLTSSFLAKTSLAGWNSPVGYSEVFSKLFSGIFFMNGISGALVLWIIIALGFLLGWGIHSLMRKLRK